jgi:hypothetical protein
MALRATPPKCRHCAKDVSVRLDHRPCRDGIVERADAAPFVKKTRERFAEVDCPEPRWAFRQKDRTEEVIDAAPGSE